VYTGPDPIGVEGGLFLYAYCKDAWNWIDPFGLSGGCDRFPDDPNDLTKQLGVEPKVGTTPDGTVRMTWQPNENTKIRFESHPEGLVPGDPGFNPRHHGPHYHVETRPPGQSWSQRKTKAHPPGYTPGSGTGFLPGESFPGK